LRILRELGPRSYIGVPLTVRDQVCGVISFIAAESRRRYDVHDLELAQDLAHRAAVAIDNARLYAEVKETDQRKDEFLAMLSHELRNPLTPIRNALQILKMPEADEAARATARQMMERQLQHMIRLVDDLLDVSRVMRGKIGLRKELIDVAAAVARGVETAQPAIDARGQHLIATSPPAPLVLEADPTRLAQIVGNLLSNAAKFSSRAGRIWLTLERQGDELVLRVKDEARASRASCCRAFLTCSSRRTAPWNGARAAWGSG